LGQAVDALLKDADQLLDSEASFFRARKQMEYASPATPRETGRGADRRRGVDDGCRLLGRILYLVHLLPHVKGSFLRFFLVVDGALLRLVMLRTVIYSFSTGHCGIPPRWFEARPDVSAFDRAVLFSIWHTDIWMSRRANVYKCKDIDILTLGHSSVSFTTVAGAKQKKTSGAAAQPARPDRKRTTIYLPMAQYRALKIFAVQNDKEMSEVVSEALKKLGIEG
jgi:hypothetical protein